MQESDPIKKAAQTAGVVGAVGGVLILNIILSVIPLAIAIFLAMWALRSCT